MKNAIKVDNLMVKSSQANDDTAASKTSHLDKLSSSDPQMQDFLRKVTRIVALLLKDQTAPKELHKSVLKFLKIVITFLNFGGDQETSNELTSLILVHVFSLQNSAKYTMIIRRILNKLISRVGLQMVLQCTAKEHHALINYIERARRKRLNAKQRAQFLLG